MISIEEFETIAAGDTIHVSKEFRVKSRDVGGTIVGGFDWVAINHYQNTVSVHLTGQSKSVMQALNGCTVVPRKYITAIVKRSGEHAIKAPKYKIEKPGQGVHRGHDRSSIFKHERLLKASKMMENGANIYDLMKELKVSRVTAQRYINEVNGDVQSKVYY